MCKLKDITPPLSLSTERTLSGFESLKWADCCVIFSGPGPIWSTSLSRLWVTGGGLSASDITDGERRRSLYHVWRRQMNVTFSITCVGVKSRRMHTHTHTLNSWRRTCMTFLAARHSADVFPVISPQIFINNTSEWQWSSCNALPQNVRLETLWTRVNIYAELYYL